MAGVFLRLKLALLRSGFRSSKSYLALYLVGTILALGLGIGIGIGLAALLGGGAAKGEVLLLVVFPLIWVIWVFAPLLNSGQGDETVDPSRFELLPLSFGQQVRGLLVVGLAGPAALGTLIGALGPAFSADTSFVARLLLVAVAVAFVVLCVSWSRALGAALSGVANSRRGKELTVVIAGFVGIGMYFISRALSSATTELVDIQSAGYWNALAILPPGALGRSIPAFREGQWLIGAGLLAWGVIGSAIALAIWRWALARRLKGGGSGGHAAAAVGPVGASVLYPRFVSWLPRSATGATTAKEMRYYLFRSTLQLQQLVLGTLIALLFAGQSLVGNSPTTRITTLIGAFVLFFVLFQSAPNVFGIDNAAVSGYLLTGVDMSKVLLGKFLALLLIGFPLGLVIQVAVTAYRGDWGSLPLGIAALPVPWLVWLGLGGVLSVWAAYPIKAGRSQNNGRALASVFGGLAVAVVVLTAVAFLAIGAASLVGSPWAGVGTGWVLGLIIGLVGLRVAGNNLRRHPTRLLNRLGGDTL